MEESKVRKIEVPRTRPRVTGNLRSDGIGRLAAVLVAVVVIVAACGPAGGSAAPTTGSVAPPSVAPSDGAAPSGSAAAGGLEPPATKVDLVVWNPFTGPDGAFFSQIVDDFNAETPNVQVTVETQVGAEYIAKLEAAAAANQLPHVIAAGYDALPLLTENGIVTPIDDLATQAGLDASDFPEAIWNAGQWKDQRVGIPIDTHTMNFYYNKKLFTDAGLDPEKAPATREEFEAAIKAVQDETDADGYQMVASGAGANFLVGIQFAALFYQGGGEWTNADFTEATFNSDAGVEAATYLKHLVDDLGVPKVESDAEINAFQQGKNAMVMSGIWETTRYNDALGPDLGVAPIPAIFGDGTWGGSHNLAVTAAADGDLRQGAYYFIDWFSRNSLQWGAAGQIPARNEVRESPEFQNASGEGLLPLIAQVAPLAESVKFLPTIPGGGDLLFVANGAGEAATFAINGTDPKQALDAAATFNSQILQENKTKYGF
jgi:multiple sugar transport system substrate-binding protein